jgi:hypothetical protein
MNLCKFLTPKFIYRTNSSFRVCLKSAATDSVRIVAKKENQCASEKLQAFDWVSLILTCLMRYATSSCLHSPTHKVKYTMDC